MNNEMKNMARRLGMSVPEDASEHEQLAAIANQCGMPDYYYNSADNAKLYNALKDMCGEYGIPDDVAGTDYDPELEPDYMSQKYQDNREDLKDDDSDGSESSEESGDGEDSSDSSSDSSDSSSDSDSSNPNDNGYDPNKQSSDQQEVGPDGKPINNQQNQPNQTQDQRDNPNGLDDPNNNGYNPDDPKNPNNQGGKDNSDASAGVNQPGANGAANSGDAGSGAHKGLPDGGDSGSAGANAQGNAGNGYGALKNKKNGQTGNVGGTDNARRTLEHNKRMNGGSGDTGSGSSSNSSSGSKSSTKGKSTSSSSSSSSGSKSGGIGSKIKNGFKNGLNKLGGKRDGDNEGDGAGSGGGLGSGLKRAILNFFKRHPIALIYAFLALFIFIVLLAVLMSSSDSLNHKNAKKTCTYNLSGVTSTGTVELKNIKVELVNCDAKKEDYTVLETIDFEKYILGVALAEAGPDSPDEALKAQMIAVRGFSLYRNNGMCPSNPDDCFYGYNASTGVIRLRACTNDQVYWDYTEDIYQKTRSGQPSLYGDEAVDGGTIWKKALSSERIKEVEQLANSVVGEVLLDNNGNVLNTNYTNVETQKFIDLANEGKGYKEILESVYGSSSYSSATCTYSGIDYGDYTLSSDGTTILHEPIDDFLKKNGSSLEELNELIEANVEKNGYGTRAGVVAAAVTLLGELGDNYGVKVPYYWGGGHYDGVVVGALNTWGSTSCHTYANGQSYNYCGLDCSGFVPWAIKNGGFNSNHALAGGFTSYFPGATKVTLSSSSAVVEPGDLLESSGHIILIVGIDDENKQYICAEAMGNAYGVTFSRRSFGESGYWGVDMSGYYDNESNIRSK